MTSSPQRFQWRAFTSVLIAIAFIVLVLSGALLFLSPPGRVANWTDWRLFGLTKHDWTALHISFSALFILITILHLIFNWRPMLNYFKNRITRRLGWRPEWTVALVLSGVVFVGARQDWPPFSQLLAWNESLKQSWDEPAQRAPVPHAELLSLRDLAREADVELSVATERLAKAGAIDFTPETEIQDIATSMNLPAQQVYEILVAANSTGKGTGGHRPGQSGGGGGGGGTGWKTLETYCAEQGIELDQALQILQARGWEAEAAQTMREIAANNGMDRPFELLEALRSRP